MNGSPFFPLSLSLSLSFSLISFTGEQLGWFRERIGEEEKRDERVRNETSKRERPAAFKRSSQDSSRTWSGEGHRAWTSKTAPTSFVRSFSPERTNRGREGGRPSRQTTRTKHKKEKKNFHVSLSLSLRERERARGRGVSTNSLWICLGLKKIYLEIENVGERERERGKEKRTWAGLLFRVAVTADGVPRALARWYNRRAVFIYILDARSHSNLALEIYILFSSVFRPLCRCLFAPDAVVHFQESPSTRRRTTNIKMALGSFDSDSSLPYTENPTRWRRWKTFPFVLLVRALLRFYAPAMSGKYDSRKRRENKKHATQLDNVLIGVARSAGKKRRRIKREREKKKEKNIFPLPRELFGRAR